PVRSFSCLRECRHNKIYKILVCPTNLPTTLGLCVRLGVGKTSRPELKPIKVTKVENIFYSSSVFRQLDMQPIEGLKDEDLFVTPR
ncbi:MAG: hypothetical protein ABIT06_09610, partial [Saprospiraceae bacterium]